MKTKQDGEGDDVLDNRLSKTRSEGILFGAEWEALDNRSLRKTPCANARSKGRTRILCRKLDDLQVSGWYFGIFVVFFCWLFIWGVVVAGYIIPFPGSLCGCELKLKLNRKLVLVWDSIVGS